MPPEPSAPPPLRSETSAPVIIVGGGPVGLALALGLDRHGIRSLVLERDDSLSRHSKAAAIHVRTRELLRRWGVEDTLLRAGTLHSSITLHAVQGDRPRITLPFTDLQHEAEDPGLLLLEQSETERVLLDELRASALAEVRFASAFAGLEQTGTHVVVTTRSDRGEEHLEASFVVGCDGASSSVRAGIGLPFEGITYRLRPMLADVRVEDDRDGAPWPRQRHDPGGMTTALRLRPGFWRIIRLDDGRGDSPVDAGRQATEDEVRHRVGEVLGAGPVEVEVVWTERLRIHKRASPRFRVGRVLLAGDAAHVHSPLGGLGMNAGIQDAADLAWKLATAVRGGDVDRLLASYDVERRAVVVEQVSRTTDLATRVFLQSPAAVRERSLDAVRRLLEIGALRRRGLRAVAMLDLRYPRSPLLDRADRSAGVRLPDPVVVAPDGRECRLHRLLPQAGPVLLQVSSSTERPAGSGGAALAGDRAPQVASLRVGPGGHRDEHGVLRGLLGKVDGWILVRPDGHVVWARPGAARPDDGALRWSLGVGSGGNPTVAPGPADGARTGP